LDRLLRKPPEPIGAGNSPIILKMETKYLPQKICPLTNTNFKGDVCKKEECAWYNAEAKQCAILSISKCLELI